ncbi:MAG: Hsp20/alpha crystallin family protein [Phycisphaerales bacterium]|jgi:HSP20 family molecular chaperone IbpA|nr:Hsp20/alpha crystallin family protein [Phycisphaerales bacterium]
MTTETNNTNVSEITTEPIATAKRPQNYRAPVDVYETEAEFRVLADMPGARSETIEISVEDNMLTITAEVADRYGDLGEMRFQEYGVGDFHRSFRIGDGVDADAISAVYRDGVLEVTLPKAAAVKSRRIDIKTD